MKREFCQECNQIVGVDDECFCTSLVPVQLVAHSLYALRLAVNRYYLARHERPVTDAEFAELLKGR